MHKIFPIALVLIAAYALPLCASTPKSFKPKPAATATPTGPLYASRGDVMVAAADIAERQGLDPAWVQQILAQARFIPSVPRLMAPAPTGTLKNWKLYRSRFIDSERITAGVRFWRANRATLERAEKEYGVPAEIIVGIIGVETIYGQNTGNFRVLDALTTLAFDFPASHPRAQERSAYFKGELAQYLSLTQRAGIDPLSLRGSYAGAMGLPQFMPTSWVNFAVDFDGDNRVDLFNNPADAIGSVASYFKAFNWQPGMPVYYPVQFDPKTLDMDAMMALDILPTFSIASFQALGAVLEGPALQHSGPLALVELQNGGDPPQYVAGTENFYAITRYNWSSYYAMAVVELGRAVAKAKDQASN